MMERENVVNSFRGSKLVFCGGCSYVNEWLKIEQPEYQAFKEGWGWGRKKKGKPSCTPSPPPLPLTGRPDTVSV